MHKKSQIWVSAVLYTLVAAISIAFILQAGLPLIEGMRDRATFERMKTQMSVIDEEIQRIASEGKGSQRYIPFELSEGNLILDEFGLRWEVSTSTRLVEPRSSYNVGNLLISANGDVVAREFNDYYILENTYLSVNFLKAGTPGNKVSINTSDIIQEVTVLSTGNSTSPQLSFGISGDESSQSGIGYTSLTRTGRRLGSSSHVTHLDIYDDDDFLKYSYELHIVLEGETDFIRPEIRNFRSH